MNCIGDVHFISEETADLFDNAVVFPTMRNSVEQVGQNGILFPQNLIVPNMDELPNDASCIFPFAFVGVLYLPDIISYVFVNLKIDLESQKYLISLRFGDELLQKKLCYNPFVKPMWLDLYTYAIECNVKVSIKSEDIAYSKNGLSLLNVKSARVCPIGRPIEKIFDGLGIPIFNVQIVPYNGRFYGRKDYNTVKYQLVISFGDSKSGCIFSNLKFGVKIVSKNDTPSFFVLNVFESSITGNEIFPLYGSKDVDSWLSSGAFFAGLKSYGFRLENILYGKSTKAKSRYKPL